MNNLLKKRHRYPSCKPATAVRFCRPGSREAEQEGRMNAGVRRQEGREELEKDEEEEEEEKEEEEQ